MSGDAATSASTTACGASFSTASSSAYSQLIDPHAPFAASGNVPSNASDTSSGALCAIAKCSGVFPSSSFAWIHSPPLCASNQGNIKAVSCRSALNTTVSGDAATSASTTACGASFSTASSSAYSQLIDPHAPFAASGNVPSNASDTSSGALCAIAKCSGVFPSSSFAWIHSPPLCASNHSKKMRTFNERPCSRNALHCIISPRRSPKPSATFLVLPFAASSSINGGDLNHNFRALVASGSNKNWTIQERKTARVLFLCLSCFCGQLDHECPHNGATRFRVHCRSD